LGQANIKKSGARIYFSMEIDEHIFDAPLTPNSYEPFDVASPKYLDWSEMKAIFENHQYRDEDGNYHELNTLNQKINAFMLAMSYVAGFDGHSSSTSNYIYYKTLPHTLNDPTKPHLERKTVTSWMEQYSNEYVMIRTDESVENEYYLFLDHVLEKRSRKRKEPETAGPKKPISRPTKRRRTEEGEAEQPRRTLEMEVEEEIGIADVIHPPSDWIQLKLARLWRYHPARRNFQYIIFSPYPPEHEQAPGRLDLNTFSGLFITKEIADERYAETKEAGLTTEAFNRMCIILRHIFTVWCQNPEEDFIKNLGYINAKQWDKVEAKFYWIMSFFAQLIQEPWEIPRVAAFLVGNQGSGKSIILTEVMKKIIGDKWFQQTSSVTDVGGNFNKMIEDKLMIFLDESNNASAVEFDAALKALVTEKTQRVREMRQDVRFVNNFSRCVFATNNPNAVPNEQTRRRFMAFECIAHKPPEYYRKLVSAIKDDDSLGVYTFARFLYRFIDTSLWKENGMKPISTPFMDTICVKGFTPVPKFLERILNLGCHRTIGSLNDREDFDIACLRDKDPVWEKQCLQNKELEKVKLDSTEWVNVISVKDLYDAFM
jgi:hypothetical protein